MSCFSDNIKMLCRHHGIRMDQLAEKAGVRPDWLRRAVSTRLAKITKSNTEQITKIAIVLNVEPNSLFADTSVLPIDVKYTDELNEVIDMTNKMLAYRDKKLNQYVTMILQTYGIDKENPSHYELRQKTASIILMSRQYSSSRDTSDEDLRKLLTPYRSVKENQPPKLAWKGNTPNYHHKSMAANDGNLIFNALISRGFAEDDIIRLMNAYYDHFRLWSWSEDYLPALDYILRNPAKDVSIINPGNPSSPVKIQKPDRTILDKIEWQSYDDSEYHDAQSVKSAIPTFKAMKSKGHAVDSIYPAMNALWDHLHLSDWDKSHLPMLDHLLRQGVASNSQIKDTAIKNEGVVTQASNSSTEYDATDEDDLAAPMDDSEPCSECNGSGLSGICISCNGDGHIYCESCNGMAGDSRCLHCIGRGDIACQECNEGYIACHQCGGDGIASPIVQS